MTTISQSVSDFNTDVDYLCQYYLLELKDLLKINSLCYCLLNN